MAQKKTVRDVINRMITKLISIRQYVFSVTALITAGLILYESVAPNCPSLCSCSLISNKNIEIVCNSSYMVSIPDFAGLEDSDAKIHVYISQSRFSHLLQNRFWHIRNKLHTLEIVNNSKPITVLENAFTFVRKTLEVLKLEPVDLKCRPIDLGEGQPYLSLVNLRDLRLTCGANSEQYISTLQFPSSLTTLHLHHCYVVSLLKTKKGFKLEDLDKLEELDISRNNLTKFPAQLAPSLTSTLKRLYLNDNEISSLEAGDIPKNCKLKSLHLRNNKLTSISEDVLENCKDLRELDLSDNPSLSKVSEKSFRTFHELDLDISRTGVTSLEFIFAAAHRMNTITAHNMHVPCECEIAYFLNRILGLKLEGSCKHRWKYFNKELDFMDFKTYEVDFCEGYHAKEKEKEKKKIAHLAAQEASLQEKSFQQADSINEKEEEKYKEITTEDGQTIKMEAVTQETTISTSKKSNQEVRERWDVTKILPEAYRVTDPWPIFLGSLLHLILQFLVLFTLNKQNRRKWD